MNVLIAGASGYYGSILTKHLIDAGINCIGVDLLKSELLLEENQIICDLCDYGALEAGVSIFKIDAIVHLATQIDFAVKSQKDLYKNNVDSTENLARLGKKLGIKTFIFTSSNSIFLGQDKEFILSDDSPIPVDMYGRSKVACEELLMRHKEDYDVAIIRCPNIIDSGRLGMMYILFELIRNDAILWVLGDGSIRHQCIYAGDLNVAIEKLLQSPRTDTYNIGSENVPTFREMFENVIRVTRSKSKIKTIPMFFAIALLKLLYKLRLSPMGPYQFRMLTRSFEFDLTKIKEELKWQPSKTNTEIIEIAYNFYAQNLNKVKVKGNATSAPVNMGILNILKFIKW